MRSITRSSGPRTASTMQNSDAPRAAVSSAADSRVSTSSRGVARTGDSKRADWLQKAQSSEHPPVLPDTIPSTSTVGPHHASRTWWARAPRAGVSEAGSAARAASSSPVSVRRSSRRAVAAVVMQSGGATVGTLPVPVRHILSARPRA